MAKKPLQMLDGCPVTAYGMVLPPLYCLIVTSIVTMTGAVSDYVGGRYAALPSFYLLMTVMVFYIILSYSKIRYFFFLLLVTSVFTGIYEYRPSAHNTKNQYIRFLDCMGCPNWENEIINFRANENYLLKIWPYPKKNMSLN